MVPIYILTVLALVAAASAKSCKTVDALDEIDEAWYKRVSVKGWDDPIGSKVKLQHDRESVNKGPGKNKLCFHTEVKVNSIGPHKVKTHCKYDTTVIQQYCVLETGDTPFANLLTFHGNFTVTKSDSENYAVVYGCVNNREYWTVMVPKGTTADYEASDYKADVEAHLTDVLGVDINDAKSEDDAVFLGTIHGNPACKKGALGKVKGLTRG